LVAHRFGGETAGPLTHTRRLVINIEQKGLCHKYYLLLLELVELVDVQVDGQECALQRNVRVQPNKVLVHAGHPDGHPVVGPLRRVHGVEERLRARWQAGRVEQVGTQGSAGCGSSAAADGQQQLS